MQKAPPSAWSSAAPASPRALRATTERFSAFSAIRNPHFVFAEASRKGYGVCEFTPGRLTTTLRVVSDVTRRDAGIETLATFAVESGSARIEQA